MKTPLETLISEMQSKGYGCGVYVTEADLRREYSLPSWVGIAPALILDLNAGLGSVVEVVDPQEGPRKPSEETSNDSQRTFLDDLFDFAEAFGQTPK